MGISDLSSLQFMAGDKHYTLGIHVIHVVYILASHWTE